MAALIITEVLKKKDLVIIPVQLLIMTKQLKWILKMLVSTTTEG